MLYVLRSYLSSNRIRKTMRTIMLTVGMLIVLSINKPEVREDTIIKNDEYFNYNIRQLLSIFSIFFDIINSVIFFLLLYYYICKHVSIYSKVYKSSILVTLTTYTIMVWLTFCSFAQVRAACSYAVPVLLRAIFFII